MATVPIDARVIAPAGMVTGVVIDTEAVGLLVVSVAVGTTVIGKVKDVQVPEQVITTVLFPDSGAYSASLLLVPATLDKLTVWPLENALAVIPVAVAMVAVEFAREILPIAILTSGLTLASVPQLEAQLDPPPVILKLVNVGDATV